jgi:hypothetical protein
VDPRSDADAVIRLARDARCRRVWLVTTNDNVPAQAWYERRSFRRVAVHEGAVSVSRKLKPSIPLIAHGGVPVTDEIEYEYPIL